MILFENYFLNIEPPFGYTLNDIQLLYVPPSMEEIIIWLSGKRFNAIKIYSTRTGIKDITLCAWFFFISNRQYINTVNLLGMFLKGKTLEEMLSN